ncbi:PREDICTED: DNA repair protein complementing XP-G cells homolog [Drosophila arizonae]|uniref:DNA repair protein complementing XP-G cells homolog n=1 Tax=Drosophila arizonae TaxID=7263 RepID=A0ABM1NZA2_DROAR|nr:PREDICTED: DNA repair protein complementing XP-G cells homolog [Drosophila arizonae]
MGVTGLWKLIEPCGKPVPVETLEGKVLAIDISIWLHQAVKGFQDSKGSALNNAHLLGLFHRLCKLLYYRVRPVFIFDGGVPQLKRDTIARRHQQRNKLSNEADRIQALLLQSLAKEKVVQQALGKNAELLLKSPGKRLVAEKSNKSDEDDLFKLPELPAATAAQLNDSNEDYDSENYDGATTTSDSSFDESNARRTYDASLQAIDVRSQHFKNLPADVRHEILTDIKETRKQSSWGRLHELPARSDEFCSFQMKRLLKRRAVQESLEEAQQEMGGHTLTYAELSEFFSEEGIVTPTAIAGSTRQISSDEHTRFLLVRDLKKKAMAAEKSAETSSKCETIKEEIDEKPSTSTKAFASTEASTEVEKKKAPAKCDVDLELALSLFLDESKKVYDDKDYEYDADQNLRLNREQSKNLRHAAKGPARSYMIEYAGMNEEEVGNIMESTQLNDTQSIESLLQDPNGNDYIGNTDMANNSIEEAKQLALAIELSQQVQVNSPDKADTVQTIDSDTDSDLEEVDEATVVPAGNGLQIRIDVKDALNKDDDLFADIFDEEYKVNTSIKPETDGEDAEIKCKDVSSNENIPPKDAIKVNESMIETKNTNQLKESESKEDETQEDTKKIDEDKLVVSEVEDNSKKDLLSSILSDLKKQSEEVKNITLDLTEENEEPKPPLSSILDELKRQTDEVKNIKLESVKISNSMVIELSSDDESAKVATSQASKDVIDLCDNESEVRRTSPNKTPSKTKPITDFFETTYKIKRTPDKPDATNVTPPASPMVAKPFFVKRTPKSGRKRAGEEPSDDDVSPNKKSSKAAKSLFGNEANEQPEKTKTVNPEEILKDAAEALKSQKTAEELQEMANNLAGERRELEAERNRQDRMGLSISQRMSSDCQDLLRLFGIPYIVAPMEAEAQCAFLNAVGITNGTITDDSDIWLFGGRTVYKNFFAQNKHVLEFRAEQIEKTFNCNRGKLIQLACLVGSDYTTGIHGIGAVTALEILASFSTSTPNTESSPNSSSSGVSMQSVLSTLEKFREWWQAHKSSNLPIGSSARLSLLKKLKNIELHEGFPSSSVVEAYLTPKVDDNRDAFSWGSPDVESIREFSRKSFGWTTSKTDDILMPVMKKINEKKIQGSIRNYFTAKSALRVQQPKVSKRVQTAIDKMSGKIDAETPEKPTKPTRRTRAKKTKAAEPDEANVNDATDDNQPTRPKRVRRKTTTAATEEAAESSSTLNATIKPVISLNSHHTKEIILQRERDMEQMRQNKAKAAAILKASAKTSK